MKIDSSRDYSPIAVSPITNLDGTSKDPKKENTRNKQGNDYSLSRDPSDNHYRTGKDNGLGGTFDETI